MLSMLTNLTKAAVAVAVTPVTAVADILTMPASADRGDPHPFGKTAAVINRARECFNAATAPHKDSE